MSHSDHFETIPPAEKGSNPQGLGDRIASFRHHEGLSVERLADMLEVSRQAVWYWESGRREPRPKVIALLEKMGMKIELEFGAANFATLVQTAKRRLANDLGIEPDRIHVVIEN